MTRKKPENMMQRELIEALVKQQGTLVAAAATLGVSRSAVMSWKSCRRLMSEPTHKLIEAVLNNPKQYAKYKVLARPAHRQTAEQLELFDREVARAKL